MKYSDRCTGLRLTLTWVIDFLDDPRCPVKVTVDWSNDRALRAVIKAVVCSKAAAAGASLLDSETHLVPLVLQAFLSVYEFAAHFRHDKLPLHFVHLGTMTPLEESMVKKGVVLLDRKWASKLRAPIVSVSVALFDVTIDPSIDIDNNSDIKNEHPNSPEHRLTALRRFADTLADHGVTAVISQKIIPPYLQVYLLTKGIFSLDRLGSSHIRRSFCFVHC